MNSRSERNTSGDLALNGVEEFMHSDHRNAYPIYFYHTVVLKGDFSRHQLAAAIESASRPHARVTSFLAQRHGRTCLRMSPPQVSAPSLDWIECSASDQAQQAAARFWDQRNFHPRPAVRFLAIRSRSDGSPVTQLFLEVYHAVFDGLFTLQYLGEIVRSVLSLSPLSVEGQDALPSASDSSQAKDRHLLSPNPGLFAYARTISSFFRDGPHPLVSHQVVPADQWLHVQAAEGDIWPFPSAQLIEVHAPELRRIKIAAAKMGANLNGILIAAIFFAIKDFWRQERSSSHQVGVCIPVSFRARRGRLQPLNGISYVFLRRSLRQVRSLGELAHWVTESLASRSITEMAAVMTRLFDWLAWTRVLLPLVTRLPRSMATVIISNCGNVNQVFYGPTRSKQLKAEPPVLTYTGIPYLRPGSQAGFGIGEIDGFVTISCVFDTHSLTPAQCDAFMAHLRHHLDQIVAGDADHLRA